MLSHAQSPNTTATLVHKDKLISYSVKLRIQVRRYLGFGIGHCTLIEATVESPGPNFMIENVAHHVNVGTCNLHV